MSIEVQTCYKSFKVKDPVFYEGHFFVLHAMSDLGSDLRRMRQALVDLWDVERDIYLKRARGWLAAVNIDNKKMRRWLLALGASCYRLQGERMLFMKIVPRELYEKPVSLRCLARRINGRI